MLMIILRQQAIASKSSTDMDVRPNATQASVA